MGNERKIEVVNKERASIYIKIEDCNMDSNSTTEVEIKDETSAVAYTTFLKLKRGKHI